MRHARTRKNRESESGKGKSDSMMTIELKASRRNKGPAPHIAALAAIAASLMQGASLAAEKAEWPTDVPGFVPVKPGEHPRLVFRKTQLPALKKRAERPEGKVMIERLKKQLAGKFTLWHASGYAFLYQITGEKQYADKAFDTAQETLTGRANPDGRYTWPGNGQLRAGPCLSGMALAYDMAYDGWDEAQRKKIADGIMANPYFDQIPTKPRHCPGCNHWGAHTGGCGVALLALKDDPGIPRERIDRYLGTVIHNIKRAIMEGHGKYGYYYEGHHCGRLAVNTGMLLFMQAYREAMGKDLVPGCSNAEWQLTKWVYEFVDHGPERHYTYNSRGMYRREFDRTGMSTGGDFAHGFGVCPDKHKPAVLWLYNHIVEPGEKTYDIMSLPHRAPYAFVNWPLDVKERNPGELFPLVLAEEGPGYFLFRNGWKDKGNIVVTALLGSTPAGGRRMARGGSIEVCGRGIKYVFPGMFHTSRMTYFRAARDGSGVLSAVLLDQGKRIENMPADAIKGEPTAMAVDFSGASGADLLVAQVGAQVGHTTAYWLQIEKAVVKDMKGLDGYYTRTTRIGKHVLKKNAAPDIDLLGENEVEEEEMTLGEKQVKPPTWCVMTLQKGPAPKVNLEDGKIVVGGQTLSFDGKKITMEKMGETDKRVPLQTDTNTTLPK